MKYSKQITREICKYIEEGNTLKDSAILAGISPKTLHEWKKTKRDFRNSVKLALRTYKSNLIKLLHTSVVNKQDARTTLEILARRFPDEWKERTEHEFTVKPAEHLQGVIKRIEKRWINQEASTKTLPPVSSSTKKAENTG